MYETAALYGKHGVKLLTENVLGVPGEMFETALDTLRVNMKIKPDIANASLFAPYPKLVVHCPLAHARRSQPFLTATAKIEPPNGSRTPRRSRLRSTTMTERNNASMQTGYATTSLL
jgi:hypothetical protein